MKRLVSVLLGLLFVTISKAYADDVVKLHIVYPANNSKINAGSTFFVGNTDPHACLKINNRSVKVYPNGSFVYVVNLKPGKNNFLIESSYKNKAEKAIYALFASNNQKVLPSTPLVIDKSSIYPSEDLTLITGDVVNVVFKGSKDNNAYFNIGNDINFSMQEQKTGRLHKNHTGIYKGSYVIHSGDVFNNVKVRVVLSKKDSKISDLAKGTVTTANQFPLVAEIKSDKAVIRTAPDKSRLTPLPAGTRVNLTGKDGDYYRFGMGSVSEGWIDADSISILPQGTPVAESTVTSVSFESSQRNDVIRIPLTQKLPFTIDDTPHSLTLNIYGATADINVLKQPPLDSLIKEIKWSQPYKGVFNLSINLNNPALSGYSYKYDNNTLVITIKKPEISCDNVLQGKVITLDPGHGGTEYGSVGPTGVPEKKINLAIAEFLKEDLLKSGVKVVMTRDDDRYVGLNDRVNIAALNNSDLLISVHNNALPDGHNPYKEHGSGTYYYHSQSLPLAKSIQSSLLKNLNLRDNGVFWDSLALVRPADQPSVLVEVAFMINPDEYSKLIDESFQKQAANAIYEGIKCYYTSLAAFKN